MSIHKSTHERDFVILDNTILRSPKLSLKAKGLLAFCLSLPEDWSFNIQGLAHFSVDGVDSVRSAVKELEAEGYILRQRKRADGKYSGMEYEIFEVPQLGNPATGNSPLPSTELPSTNVHSIYNTQNLSNYDGAVEAVRKRIEYDVLCQRYDSRLLEDIVSVITEVMVNRGQSIVVSREKSYPTDYVRSCLARINPLHVEQIVDALERDQPVIRNIRGYLLAALINAANTMDTAFQYGDY